MGDAARQIKRMEMELADAPPRLTDDNHREILVRLPAKDVLRCGTVCKAWRLITADPGFLANNALRQPDEVVLYRYVRRELPRHQWATSGQWELDVVLDALVVSGDLESQRSVVCYPKPDTGGWLLLAVCNGVLLFKKKDGVYILCNPTTRKWAEFPQLQYPPLLPRPANLKIDDSEFAFYFHQPSSEYRLLCYHKSLANRKWCILSTGQDEPRNNHSEAGNAAGITTLVPCLRKAVTAPLALHGNLHWPPHRVSVADKTRIVLFGILSETFSQMEGPPVRTRSVLVKLFTMDGLLVGANFAQARCIDLWFLENYGNAARWELRHRVATPWGTNSTQRPLHPLNLLVVAAASDEEGNVMLGNNHGLVVYNVRKETVKTINSEEALHNNDVVVLRHVFRANPVQHPHFSTLSAANMRSVHF